MGILKDRRLLTGSEAPNMSYYVHSMCDILFNFRSSKELYDKNSLERDGTDPDVKSEGRGKWRGD